MSQPTTAARAGTDRLWVTATGRLVLLDWRTLDDGEGGDPLPIDDVAALQAFLLAVARAGAGRGTEAGGKGRLPATPMSMGDIELLSRLEDRKFGSAGQILDALRNLSGRPVRISTARRIASVGVPLALVGLVAASIVALDPDERAWARAYPDLPSPDAVVSYYRSTAMEDSAKRKAVEVLVATRYREALTDTSFWAAPGLSRRVVRERPRIERMLEERAEPTPADSAAAEAILKGPLRWDARLLRSSYGVGFVLVAWSAITVLSMLGILGTGRVPGLRLFGMSIIDRRGRRASRLRKLARSALGLAIVIAGVTASVTLELLARRLGQAASRSAWFPVGGIGRVFLAVHHVWPFAVSALLFALVIFLLAYRWPTRAPQDWITRTRLVPD